MNKKKSRLKILVYGVGINDSDYNVYLWELIGGVRKMVWRCPFYEKWKSMLRRCYSEEFHNNNPTYSGCSTSPEWHRFMTFRAWMENQEWEGKHLDKDLLVKGNKIYGPDTCVFLTDTINYFLKERGASRGSFPIGVHFEKQTGKFVAQIGDTVNGGRLRLGYFDTPEEAHQAWLTEKLRQAKILTADQSDPRVAEALINRYENYDEI